MSVTPFAFSVQTRSRSVGKLRGHVDLEGEAGAARLEDLGLPHVLAAEAVVGADRDVEPFLVVAVEVAEPHRDRAVGVPRPALEHRLDALAARVAHRVGVDAFGADPGRVRAGHPAAAAASDTTPSTTPASGRPRRTSRMLVRLPLARRGSTLGLLSEQRLVVLVVEVGPRHPRERHLVDRAAGRSRPSCGDRDCCGCRRCCRATGWCGASSRPAGSASPRRRSCRPCAS